VVWQIIICPHLICKSNTLHFNGSLSLSLSLSKECEDLLQFVYPTTALAAYTLPNYIIFKMFEIYPQNKSKQNVVKENIESSRVFYLLN
jgi:hypothetical protein